MRPSRRGPGPVTSRSRPVRTPRRWRPRRTGPSPLKRADKWAAALGTAQASLTASESLVGMLVRTEPTEAALRVGIQGLVDERRLPWHRAAGLLGLATHQLTHRKGEWVVRAHMLLDEGARLCRSAFG